MSKVLCGLEKEVITLFVVNPFLPGLATALFVCWLEAAMRQLQKTDCLNPCRARNVFKFRKQVKNWKVISTMLILSLLLGGYISIDHVILFEHLFWSHMDTRHHVLSHFLTCTRLLTCLFAEKSLLESLDSLLGLYSWVLFLPLSSKQSTFKPSKSVRVLFLNIFTQTSHTHAHTQKPKTTKTIGTKAAWSHEINKAREATLCIQRKSDQERKGVLCL